MEPITANILSAVLWAVVLGAAAWFLPLFGRDRGQRKWFCGLFALKIGVGIVVWAVYTFYYTDRATSDIYRFFADSEVVYYTLFENPKHYLQLVTGLGGSPAELAPYYESMNNWYKSFDDGFVNENRTLIRFNALLMPITFGSYFGNMVWVCFLGVWAQAFLYRQLLKRYVGVPLLLFAVINLWPSQLFWTSALMKEPLVMTGLAVSIGAALKLKNKFTADALLLLLGGLLFTLFSKFYVGIALLFPLGGFVLWRQKIKSSADSLLAYGTVLLLLICATLALGAVAPQYDIPTIVAAKQRAFANVAEATGAGSAFYIPPMDGTLPGMLMLAPSGLVNSLLRPYPTDASGLMEWAAVAENMLFLGLTVFLLFRQAGRKEDANYFLCFGLFLFGIIILALGGITVNISGALVRYKMPAIPYMALGLFMLSRYNTAAPSVKRTKM